MSIKQSALIKSITKASKSKPVESLHSPSGRVDYIAECKHNINQFMSTYPSYWIEYIRSHKKPAKYFEMLRLKSWLKTQDMGSCFRDLLQQLLDDKLRVHKRPRGVVVVAVVSGKLYTGYSLCNFSSGDKWSNSIALWKAMKRIVYLQVIPCPVVEISYTSEWVSTEYNMDDLRDWSMQYPFSTRKSVIGLTRRVLEKHVVDGSVAFADLLPVIP